MSEFYTDPYNRLEKYYQLFLLNEFDAEEAAESEELSAFLLNIDILSKRLQIPVTIVRMDLVDMLSATDENFLKVKIDSIASEADEESENVYLDRSEESYADIRDGKYDDAYIILNLHELSGSIITLNKDEVAALNKIDDDFSLYGKRINPVMLKDTDHLIPPGIEINDKLSIIKEAMEGSKEISFIYINEDDDREIVKCVPIQIVFENKYKLLIISDGVPKVLDIERICSEILLGEDTGKKPDSVLLSILPQVWGYDFESTPYAVKVKFYNDPGVFEKVRKELENRSMGTLTEENNALYYEDTVYGMEAFKKWIYSYGNSAVVIKPVALKNEIIKNYKKVVALK